MGARRVVGKLADRLVGRLACPCCESRFRAFRQPTGAPPGAECPYCRSRARHRLLWLYLAAETTIERAPLSVLHFAPEAALERRLRALPHVRYVSADIDSPRADVKTDITALDFDDDAVDLVLCSHVLEHVPDDAAALTELRRVLKPGGLAIVQSPVNYDQDGTFEDPSITSPQERLQYFSRADHVRVYGPPDLERRMAAAGFDVEIVEYAETFRPEEVERYGLVPRWGPIRNDLYLGHAASNVRT